MDQRQIDNLLEGRMASLRAIALAFSGTFVVYVGVAWIVLETLPPRPLVEVPFAVAAGVAVSQLLVILLGYLLSRSIRAAAARSEAVPPGGGDLGSAAALMQRYTVSVVFASAFREVAAVVGLVLSLLTGEITWVALLGGIALVSMLIHWPRRAAVEDWLLQQRINT